MKEFTTIEKLQMKVSATYGSVLKFGDHVLVTDACYKGGFTADIYEFVETPEETGLDDIECRLNHIGSAEQTSPAIAITEAALAAMPSIFTVTFPA